MAQFNESYTTSYQSAIVGTALSSRHLMSTVLWPWNQG